VEESEEEGTSGPAKKTSARSGTKSSGRKAAPAALVAPVLADSEDGVDKENTPSVEDEEHVPAKKTTTRTRKGTKFSVAEEMDVDADVPAAKPRAIRASKARK
jgi:hypothetical protein